MKYSTSRCTTYLPVLTEPLESCLFLNFPGLGTAIGLVRCLLERGLQLGATVVAAGLMGVKGLGLAAGLGTELLAGLDGWAGGVH